jgi:DNA invertase Pin-like site-specific DNA recombinase
MAGALKKVEDGLVELRTLAGTLAAENAILKDKHSNRKKLSEREVQRIRQFHDDGWTNTEIAEVFDVNRSTVYRILAGQYWKG